MSMKFLGNFKVMAAIMAVVLFMLIMYGYNRSERKKLAKNMQQQQQQPAAAQQKAMQAYTRPSFGLKKGCGCGAKK